MLLVITILEFVNIIAAYFLITYFSNQDTCTIYVCIYNNSVFQVFTLDQDTNSLM